MDFRRKLAQLEKNRSDVGGLNSSGDGSEIDLVDASEKSPKSVTSADSDRETALALLREQMADLMKRAPAPLMPRPLAPAPLGFSPWETSQGFVHRRSRLWNADHWIGCVPIAAAISASAEYWALVGLDPALSVCDPRRALFLDTETTGLGAGAGVLAFLVGMAWFDEQDRLVLEQLFLRSPAEEAAQLERVAERLAASSLLVTFNGKSSIGRFWPTAS